MPLSVRAVSRGHLNLNDCNWPIAACHEGLQSTQSCRWQPAEKAMGVTCLAIAWIQPR